MSGASVEVRRKAVHVGMAAFALLMPLLGWKGSALAAGLALAFNLLLLPRLVGESLSRPQDAGRRVPVGIVLYPVTVLVLILVFRHRLELAAAGWGFLAFGDGLATLVGRAFGTRRLPWNRSKSWAGLGAYVLCGAIGAGALFSWVAGHSPSAVELWALLLAALAGAAVESLPSELDDNLSAPILAALVLAVLLEALPGAALPRPELQRAAFFAVLLNASLAGAALALRVVRLSGAVAGAALGAVILAFGGLEAYALLWLFFAIGTGATRLGRRRKEALGKAEAAGGRRGAANVLANVSVPAFLVVAAALSRGDFALYRLAAAAAFATALMDTVGTEVGQAIRTPTVLLPDFRPVPPGTDGAVSVAGTAAGLVAALVLAALAGMIWGWSGRWVAVAVAAAFAGTVAESLLGREGAPWRVSNGHVLNFLNTAVGATVAAALAGLA